MMKVSCSVVAVLACLAVTLAAPREAQRGLIHQVQRGVAGPNPYIFLTVPKGRSQSLVQAFEVIEEKDNDDDDVEKKSHALIAANDEEEENDKGDMVNDNDEEEKEDKETLDKMALAQEKEEDEDVDNEDYNDLEEDDDDDDLDNVMRVNLKLRKTQAKSTQMMVSREHAGAILVPDEFIEIEGHSVIDERTGKPALLLPRAILDSIPDGSIVALMERSADDAEERANRVIVRRRRKGARRNIRRRVGANKRRINRRGGNQRRRVNKRKNVRIISGGVVNRRGGVNKRRVNRRRVSLQG